MPRPLPSQGVITQNCFKENQGQNRRVKVHLRAKANLFLPERHGQTLASTATHVPYSLDRSPCELTSLFTGINPHQALRGLSFSIRRPNPNHHAITHVLSRKPVAGPPGSRCPATGKLSQRQTCCRASCVAASGVCPAAVSSRIASSSALTCGDRHRVGWLNEFFIPHFHRGMSPSTTHSL